jgi:phosphoglycolate phosphatase
VSKARQTIFFDLDGTLTDSRPGIVRCVQYALNELDLPAPAENELLWCVGPPLKESFAKLLGPNGDADRAVALYRERFAEVGLFENSVYPGIEEVLASLRAAGVRLCVATSKAHVFATRIVEHFGLSRYLDDVFGAELTGVRSDKSELLAYALEVMGLQGRHVAMVGDRSHDMVGARNNGMYGVGVLYGYGNLAELESAGADRIVAEVAGLSGLLDGA